ncbi:MAG: O-antigen ligase family protein [Muribaculaceae bacterium]|nr:O-antigen ligase family protein [Muribaculaceae bacterium]
MDRICIIGALIVGLFYLLLSNKDKFNRECVSQIIVAMYVFSLCFSKLCFPLYQVYDVTYGSFGPSFRLESHAIFFFILLIIIAQQHSWKIRSPRTIVLIVALVYSLYIIFNPFNTVRPSALIALEYFIFYLIFLYLLSQCFELKTIIEGIYAGFSITVMLHFALAILFPVLGIDAAVTIFNSSAMIRGVERIGTPGTFGHPNTLGAFASYYFIFFFSCVLAKFKTKKSIIFAVLALIVIFLTASRSALVASLIGAIAIVGLYVFRKHKIFSPSTILKGGLPFIAILAVIWFTSPIKTLFTDIENLEEMSYARLMHYYCAGEIISDHPLVGVGLNSHLKYLVDNSALIDLEKTFENTDIEIWDPETFMFENPIHNIWLILLCELGIIGTIPIFFYIGRFFYKFKKRIAQNDAQYHHIILNTTLGIIVCLIVHGMSDWTPLTQTCLNVSLLFLYLSSYSSHISAQKGETSSSPVLSTT